MAVQLSNPGFVIYVDVTSVCAQALPVTANKDAAIHKELKNFFISFSFNWLIDY